MKKSLLFLALPIVVLITLVVIRTLSFTSKQLSVERVKIALLDGQVVGSTV